ncbi:hypothetical protein AXF42_Ash012360 [Apostasia shenzhenica]|uniref:Uncharacterized protein n=1 Tax=Apostasia shenzhenica TaxID=1088818 RepID=A0A2I0ACY8_9ASPA|nr:hypothetical protein AXF42_Ash012360 [Apostasia shenzhenica]
MANLRLAMDAAFWDLNIASPRRMEGVVRSVAGEPAPPPTARASRTVRPQQLSLLRHVLPLGIIPSFSPTSEKDLGSFALQYLLLASEFSNLVTVFSIAVLPNHDVTLEAAWPEVFLDRDGAYWEVPSSASFDVSSLVSDSGFRYRFGLHKNDGNPEAVNSSLNYVPMSLMPGLCAKAAFSFEKRRDFWREWEQNGAQEERSVRKPVWLIPYDEQLKEPHAAVSAIIGGTCEAWLGGNNIDSKSKAQIGNEVGQCSSSISSRRKHISMDLFGSFGYTFQQGKFTHDYNDLTRVDARLDVTSASAVLKGFGHLVPSAFKGQVHEKVNPLALLRFNVLLQQQIAGPIVFRVDTKFSFSSPSGGYLPYAEDVIYGLSYSLRTLQSGKMLAWYSTKRKEGMIEVRIFEF